MVSLEQLYTHLSKATDIYRDSLAKEYIFSLFFLKRCSDVFEDIRQEIILKEKAKGKSPKDADKTAENKISKASIIYVPPRSRWDYLNKEAHVNVGNYLNEALAGLEESNESLHGSLEYIDFNRNNELSTVSDKKLRILIEHFSQLKLGDRYLESPVLIGVAFQKLLSDFADFAGKKGGEFYTPKTVARLMVQLLKPEEESEVYDPCCGPGGMLVAANEFVEEHGGDGSKLKLYGQELNGTTWSLAKMNMHFNGVSSSIILNGDTLSSPLHFNGSNELKHFDLILSNPPFSACFGDKSVNNTVSFPERFKYGVVEQGSKKADWMFIQHMLHVCKDDGVVAAVIPHGVLFRSGSERSIRSRVVNEDLIESVISLPPALFYGTSIPTVLLILNKRKTAERKGKVLFIDAAYDYEEGRLSNKLREEDIKRVVDVYDNFQNNDTYSKVVSTEEVINNDFNLSVRHYVDNSPTRQRINQLNQHHTIFDAYSLDPEDEKTAVVKITRANRASEEDNSIYISRQLRKPKIYGSYPELCKHANPEHYFEVQLRKDVVYSEYAKLFFLSELGQLMLSHLPQGTTMPLLNKENIGAMNIFVPSDLEQLKIVELAKKLDIAQSQLADYRKELVTKPALLSEIQDKTDRFVYDFSSMSIEARVKQLLEINETKHIEFKQFFFLKHEQVYNEKSDTKRSEEEQKKVVKNIASFLNSEGGTLLIGVNDAGKPTGIDREMECLGIKKIEKYLKDLESRLKNWLGSSMTKLITLSSIVIEDNTIVVVDCSQAPSPVFMEGKDFFIRRAAESEALYGHDMLNYIKMHFKK